MHDELIVNLNFGQTSKKLMAGAFPHFHLEFWHDSLEFTPVAIADMFFFGSTCICSPEGPCSKKNINFYLPK